ncbi:LPS export ABC transporter periplasmic protein LptC [Piscinibacter sp. XHJ-5]|uniref:LPS export ABC transporter periplasmic protein LptC n=1 Tax=Piscinibacter sp. XHJ-5 TaxID=3037797 RepID=UPI002452AF8E|nr:LPS export ABC transporter periplasmic protein LptC [Piscinibacter sp. XHJ-5]
MSATPLQDPAVGLAPPVPARAAPAPRPPWTARLLEQASSYLPLLVMAVLALGSWWLVKNTPTPDPERPAAPLRHEPDYVMSNFMVRRFAPDGTMRAQIEGDTMRHYPDTDTLEIDNVRLRAVAPDGRVTRAEARMALSNADGSEVQLRGGAHVVREALGGEEPIEFRGEFLHAFLNTERLRSHLPVTVTRGGAEVRAESMDYDHLDRLVQLKGRVTAQFPPTGPRK